MEHGGVARTFTSALEQIYRLHTSEIQELETKVREQAEQLRNKDRQFEEMKFHVSNAKKKIKQQKEHIQLLESQQGLPHNGSVLSVEAIKTNFNKTGVSLFGESPVSRVTSTPHSGQVIDQSTVVQIPEQSNGDIGNIEEERTLTDESANDSESTEVSEEEVVIIRDDETGVDATQAESQNYPLIADPPQTCVSLFGNSAKTSPRRPLQLKRQTTRIKYKETNSNISPESASSANYENHTPNILSETELPSPDLSECNSPPFLGSSPHKTTPSTPVTYGAASVSMFHSTTKVDNDSSKFKTPPPGTRTNPIPLSDSQFSLDVSQSCPPSPELCGGLPSGSIQSRKSYQQHSVFPTTLDDKQRYLQGRNILLKTPSISLAPTMIPITPGITTVQNILGRASTYIDSDKNGFVQYFNGTSNRSKRRGSAEIEGTVPDRKKLHSNHVDGSSQADSEFKYSPNLASGAIAGTASNSTKGRSKDIGNDEDDRARLVEKYGLPEYACVTKILKRSDRAKLDGKACPDCDQWYGDDDGIHEGQREHLKHTCRHKNLHPPPNTNPALWDISFPNSEECDQLMHKQHS